MLTSWNKILCYTVNFFVKFSSLKWILLSDHNDKIMLTPPIYSVLGIIPPGREKNVVMWHSVSY